MEKRGQRARERKREGEGDGRKKIDGHRPGGTRDLNAKFRTEPPPTLFLLSCIPLELPRYPLVEFYVTRYMHASLCRRAGNSDTGQEFHVSHPPPSPLHRGETGGRRERGYKRSNGVSTGEKAGNDGGERGREVSALGISETSLARTRGRTHVTWRGRFEGNLSFMGLRWYLPVRASCWCA